MVPQRFSSGGECSEHGGSEKTETVSGRAAQLRAILQEIAERAREPDFRAEDVARKLGVGGRYVRRLLEETERTFSEHKLEHRLAHARELLADPASKHLSVTDIALMSGFGDVSYFNRSFRRRFGATPSRTRKGNGA